LYIYIYHPNILDNALIVKIPYNELALESNDTNQNVPHNVPHDVTHDVPHDVPQGGLAIIFEIIRKNPKITREEIVD